MEQATASSTAANRVMSSGLLAGQAASTCYPAALLVIPCPRLWCMRREEASASAQAEELTFKKASLLAVSAVSRTVPSRNTTLMSWSVWYVCRHQKAPQSCFTRL